MGKDRRNALPGSHPGVDDNQDVIVVNVIKKDRGEIEQRCEIQDEADDHLRLNKPVANRLHAISLQRNRAF